MKPGRPSRTAEIVCMGRAFSHRTTRVARFSDPTAIHLLPDDARLRVERALAGTYSSLRERILMRFLAKQARVMVARTVAIDDAIREARAPELVILGAGLDGRAWRMPELEDVVVFEVDHPDTQRDKRERAAALTPASKDIRFVPVDFERDSLDAALERAGHDAARPTTWVWEGVVMYLTREDVDKTLAIIARRSAPSSRVVVVYHQDALMRRALSLVVSRLGEPFRSTYSELEMRDLLHRHGFDVARDESFAQIGRSLGDADVRAATKFANHLKLVVAARRS